LKDVRQPKSNINQKSFSFVKKDFQSSTGKREDASYLSKRIREIEKNLKQNLGEAYSSWGIKTSKSTKGRNVGGTKYRKTLWTGFAVLPTTDKVPEEGLFEPIVSYKQELTIVKAFVNIDQIVPLLDFKDPQNKIKLYKIIETILSRVQ